VPGIPKAAAIFHAPGVMCARSRDAKLWCWGAIAKGKLWGDGKPHPPQAPALVEGLVDIENVEGTCVRHDDEDVTCWDETLVPRPIPELHATQLHGRCAIAERGDVWCWGGCELARDKPITLKLPEEPVQIATIDGTACVLVKDGTVWCRDGDACAGTMRQDTRFVNVGRLAGGGCAVLRDRSVACRGERMAGLADVQVLRVRRDGACVLRKQGDVFCWGSNKRGELGDTTFVDRATPAPIVF
jgi:alpha-tubulin suppressor-like RCC1 family protein